jgi:short-subunit dehydrogenase
MNIIISGGTKGIGRAIAEKFAHEGGNIAVSARDSAALAAMHEHWATNFPSSKLLTFAADLSKKEEVNNFAAHVLQHWDSVDVVVNNAGTFIPGAIHEEADGVLETLIETNLYSAYYLTKAFMPTMLAAAQGHIFNICSVASIKAYPNGGSYAISKFALLGFSKNLREELMPKGVKVTAVLPGGTWSDSWKGVELPESRLMQAADIADAIWGAYKLGPSAVVEELLIRPQLGDL